MRDLVLAYWQSIPSEWRLAIGAIYLTIGFFVGVKLHGRLWQFAHEHPLSSNDNQVTRALKSSFARWTGMMVGFFLWWLVPFMYVGGGILSQILIKVVARKHL